MADRMKQANDVRETTPGNDPLTANGQTRAEQRLAELIVSALQLEMTPQEIIPDAPLFHEGLGLDSIDALELALAISRAYGIELRSDDQQNHRIFASLRNLSAHVETCRLAISH
jgi:acyl carrier protein